ncbi:DUF2513 domain-containing protein [Cognaticolwellia beringensis]|uniref:DUF2513 domain-containing protein n=1 Tax=Cognaticolwellia beringensis TaxID=1967665 RepID=A0A222GAC9_9GAMM|nr:DUF2513 domain-containing protein [Cognaticolwellia beringensis]ASP48593.1 DUF2513 domain-containing protein [Cognaticolwellia beringensis]
MKLDIDYISSLLNAFIEADSAHIDYNYWISSGVQVESLDNPGKFDEKFIFHAQLLLENSLISNRNFESRTLKDIGISFSKNSDVVISVPIRLTQKGHDFCSALRNKEVLTKLKSELKDAPFKVLFDGSQKLIQHFAKKKLDDLLA